MARYNDDEDYIPKKRKHNKKNAKEQRKQARRNKVAAQSEWMESEE